MLRKTKPLRIRKKLLRLSQNKLYTIWISYWGLVLVSKTPTKKIEYECAQCKKTRVIYIHPKLHDKVDEKGYVEYIDIHSCVNDKMSANILYVDKFLTVRSQYVVDVGDDLSANQIQQLNIPMPKKVEFVDKTISSIKGVKYKNIKYVKIVDRLRQSNFIFGSNGEENVSEVQSELGFVTIQFLISKNVEYDCALAWFQMTAGILEAIALLDEEMLSYLICYLERYIDEQPTSERLVEIDLVLHAKTAIPSSTLKSFAIFRQMFKSLNKTIKEKGFKNYEKVLTNCIGNQHKPLIDIYEKVKKDIPFADFINYIEDLAMVGALTVQKAEMIMIQE